MQKNVKSLLKSSGDSVLHSGLQSFWTSATPNILKECNIPKTESITDLRWKGGKASAQLGLLNRADLSHSITRSSNWDELYVMNPTE
jgi:hypothetical protein